jgi:hypothetical protein
LTQTIPLPDGNRVLEALEAGVGFAAFAGAAAGAGALELAAGGGFEAAEADAGAELGLVALAPELTAVFSIFFLLVALPLLLGSDC